MSKPDWQPGASLNQLQLRARVLQCLRTYFASQAVLEVETPYLSAAATTDPALHSLRCRLQNGSDFYLHTSPEFPMKRLLAAGSGDIYQVCRVFRDAEWGRRHNPEFTMLEWYRLGFDEQALMADVSALIVAIYQVCLPGQSPVFESISYRQAFINTLAIDPLTASGETLRDLAATGSAPLPQGLSVADRDAWLDWLLTQQVIPEFHPQRFTFLHDYPASQAALARLHADGQTAARFELYYGELELANGFHELTQPQEQAERFAADNRQRQTRQLPTMPVDQHFLAALRQGLPACAGVALGLDRLLMVLAGLAHIDEVLAFAWDRA